MLACRSKKNANPVRANGGILAHTGEIARAPVSIAPGHAFSKRSNTAYAANQRQNFLSPPSAR